MGEAEKAEKGEGGGEGEGKAEKTFDLWGWDLWGWPVPAAKAEKGVGRGRRDGAGVKVNLKVQKLSKLCKNLNLMLHLLGSRS